MTTPLIDRPRTLVVEPMPPLRLFFSLEGRIGRRTYWRAGVFGLLGAGLVSTALLQVAGLSAHQAEAVSTALLVWPAIALSVKRWHDRGRSGRWVLVNLIPEIGQAWALLDNGLVRSDPGPNAYGPPPARDWLD